MERLPIREENKLNIDKANKHYKCEILSPNNLQPKTLLKKDSNPHVRTNFSNEYEPILNSDRPVNLKETIDNIFLSVSEFKKSGDVQDEVYLKHAKSNDITKPNEMDYFMHEEEVKITNNSQTGSNSNTGSKNNSKQNKIDELYGYIKPVDSPISSEKDIFKAKTSQSSSDESSLEDIDHDLNVTNPSEMEEEKKLSLDDSSISEESSTDQDEINQKTSQLVSVNNSGKFFIV